jgi:hypothetical protein
MPPETAPPRISLTSSLQVSSVPARTLERVTLSERCLRCGAAMEWRHQTWQCPRCRFKLGCCEGEACEPAAPRPRYTGLSSTHPRVSTSQNASPAYGP